MSEKLCMKFRWIFSIDREHTLLLKSIKIDHTNKKIYATLYDGKIDGQTTYNWISKISPEKILRLSTLDSAGRVIYTIVFKKPRVIAHESNFNYTSYKNAVRRIIITYEEENLEEIEIPFIKNFAVSNLMTDFDVLTKFIGMNEDEAKEYLSKLKKVFH